MVAPIKFNVSLADNKTGAKVADPRSLVGRMFQVLNKSDGSVDSMPITAVNCALQTATDQGIKPADLTNKIPLYLSYKSGVPTFEGLTKGRDFVVLGKRPGKNGSPGLMIAVDDLPELAEQVTALYAALQEAIPSLRQQAGLPGPGVPAAARANTPVTVPVNTAPTRVDLDAEDGDIPLE